MATLYLICGMAGAGKSTLAKELEITHNAFRLSPDEWIKAIIQDETNDTELGRLRDPVEQLQWATGQRLLGFGVSVILENGFWSKEERMEYREAAKAVGAEVVLHYLDVPKEELLRRIEKRNEEARDDSFCVSEKDLETWLSWFTPPDEGELQVYDHYEVHRS